MGQQPEFDLGVIGGKQKIARCSDKGGANFPSQLFRIGMFWRLGLEELRRPVAAPVWLSRVCKRPVRESISLGNASA